MASVTKRDGKVRNLTATLYTYTEPQLATFARIQGSPGKWGSFSNFITFLLAREAGDKKAVARAKSTARESGKPVMARVKPKAAKKAKAARRPKRKITRKQIKKKLLRPKLRLVKPAKAEAKAA